MLNLEHVVRYIEDTVSEYPRQDANVGGIVNCLRVPLKLTLAFSADERPVLREACKIIADKYGCDIRWHRFDMLIHKPLTTIRSDS